MGNKKSAKDMAFEKERAKFRQQIRELEREVKEEKIKSWKLEELIATKDKEIDELKDWIDRLLGYMDLSEDEMKRIIKAEKARADFVQNIAGMSSIFGKYIHF